MGYGRGWCLAKHGGRGRVLFAALTMAATAAIGTTAMPQQLAAQTAAQVSFSVPAGSLDGALTSFGRQAGLQITYLSSTTAGRRSQGVSGLATPERALAQLLAGSGLSFTFTNRTTVAISPVVEVTGSIDAGSATVLDRLVVQAQTETAWGPVEGYVATRSASGTRTDTPLIETPQSVSVVTADQITDQKAVSISEALVYTPGVASQSQAFSRMVDDVTIRGFNAASSYGSFLRDGMKYQSNVYDGGQEPYGLERLEVLRGASSMLYGQLAPGGVINAISKRPVETPLHEVNLEYGSYNRKQVSADFGGPVDADGTFLYRLTGLLRDADSWVDEFPDDKTYIAPGLTWKPDEATRLTLLGNYQHVKTRFATPLLFEDVSTGRIPRDRFLGEPEFDTYEGDTWSAGYEFDHEFDSGLKLHHKARYFSSDIQWDYMLANLAPVTNGELFRLASARNEDSYGVTADTSLEHSFEIGDSEHTVLAGFDYYRRGYDTHRYRGTGPVPLNVDDPDYSGIPDIDYTVDRGSDTVGDQYGIYLQDQIKFQDRWVLLLGGRYDWSDSTTASYFSGDVTEQDDDAFTGRAGLVYLFDNGIAPYVSVSQSFLPQAGLDYRTGEALKPNEGLQYEAGIRYEPPGTDLILSAAIYDLTQTNLVSYDESGYSYQVGKVRSRGFELEARAQFDDLGIIGAYAYTDTKILESAVPSEIGQQEEFVPRNTFSLWADYKLESLGIPGLTIGGGVRYVGETNLIDRSVNVPDYILVDALVKYDFEAVDQKFEGTSLTVNARNLFDKEYFTCAGSSGCRYGEPLTVTATLSHRW